MNHNISISNFRSFGEPVNVESKRITLNIGPNNCGKSTYSKFLELLKHSIEYNNGMQSDNYNSLSKLHTFGVSNFGRINELLHNNAENDLLSFSLTVPNEFKPDELLDHQLQIRYKYKFYNVNPTGTRQALLPEANSVFVRSESLPGIATLWSIEIIINDDTIISLEDTERYFLVHVNPDIEESYKSLRINWPLLNEVVPFTLESEKESLEIDEKDYEIDQGVFLGKSCFSKIFENYKSDEDNIFNFIFQLSKKTEDFLQDWNEKITNIHFIDLTRMNQARNINNSSNPLLLKCMLDYFTFMGHREFHRGMDEILPLFNLSKEILIERDPNYGFMVFLKDELGNFRNLADFGSGINQLLPMFILTSLSPKKDLNKLFWNKAPETFQEKSTVVIEEPEINLHPSFQSKLADMFMILSLNSKINFIIETHSEYIVRRFQYLVASKKLNNDDIVINYFWKDGTQTKCKQIYFKDNGGLTDTFENGFFDESLSLQLELLKFNSLN
jgi:energy-coupling factor transporter ATP-binding protein EcfA2